MIPIPQHLADTIISLAALKADQYETPDAHLWAATEKVRDDLKNRALTLYQLTLISLKGIGQNIKARIVFEDERLNHILDRSIFTPDGKMMMEQPVDFGFNWKQHTGDKPTYVVTLLGRAAHIIVDGKTIQASVDGLPLTDQQSFLMIFGHEGGHFTTNQNVELHSIWINDVVPSIAPEFLIAVISHFKYEMELAIQQGKTHHVVQL